MVEEKDQPKKVLRGRGNKYGPAFSLLKYLIKLLHRIGNVVILDSIFCILKGIIELKTGCIYFYSNKEEMILAKRYT